MNKVIETRRFRVYSYRVWEIFSIFKVKIYNNSVKGKLIPSTIESGV